MPAPHSVRVGYPITAEAVAETFCFTYVQNDISSAVHEVNARCFRQLPEKFFTQPLDERAGIRPKALLQRLHRLTALFVNIIPLTKEKRVWKPNCSRRRTKSYGLATVRYPVLEIEASVEPFENGRGYSLRVLRACKPRITTIEDGV
jgi:hypothetical protein